MTTPITAKVVEVPKPERPDWWYPLNIDPLASGPLFGWTNKETMLRENPNRDYLFVPGTRTLAAQAAERERIVAGLRRIETITPGQYVGDVEAAIAYIEGQPAPATDRRGG